MTDAARAPSIDFEEAHAIADKLETASDPMEAFVVIERAFANELERVRTADNGRALAVARTKMQEARMWAREALS